MEQGFVVLRSWGHQEEFLLLTKGMGLVRAGTDPLLFFTRLSSQDFEKVRLLAHEYGASLQATFKPERL